MPPRWRPCSGRRWSSPTGPSATRRSSCTPTSPTTRRPSPISFAASRAAPTWSWRRVASWASRREASDWSGGTRRSCFVASSPSRASRTWSPASPSSGWSSCGTPSGARPGACSSPRTGRPTRSSTGGPAGTPGGWRRCPSVERHDLRGRPSRVESLGCRPRALGRAREAARHPHRPRAAGADAPARGGAPGGGGLVMKTVAMALALLQGRRRRLPTATVYPFAVGEKLTYTRQARVALARLRHARGGRHRYRARASRRSGFGSGCRARRSSIRSTMCSNRGWERMTSVSRRFVQDFVENDKPKHRTLRDLPRLGLLSRAREGQRRGHTGRSARRCRVLLLRPGHPSRGGQEVRVSTVFPEGEEPGHDRGQQAGKDGAARTDGRWTASCFTR